MELYVLRSKEEIGLEIGRRIVERVKQNPYIVLGLATGSSPLFTYEAIVKYSLAENVSYKNVTTFNLDEYVGLEETNKQSYRYFMNDNLFKYLDFKKESHHFPSIENMMGYDEDIKKSGGIDIQILGIGSNGHIAFNEPFTNIDEKTHIVELTENTIKDNSRFFKSINEVPTKAITMGLNTILQSKEIFLIATGKNKSMAVKKILEGKYDPSCPASCLNLAKCKVHVYIDDECYEGIK